MMSRIGTPEIIESSEEVRLNLFELFVTLLARSREAITPYIDDCAQLLKRGYSDPFAEINKVRIYE